MNWHRLLEGMIRLWFAVTTVSELRTVHNLRNYLVTKSDIVALSSLSGSVHKTALCVEHRTLSGSKNWSDRTRS